jgi:hypothetical protein
MSIADTSPYEPSTNGSPSRTTTVRSGRLVVMPDSGVCAGRKETVKVHRARVRKASTKGTSEQVPLSFKLTLPPGTALWPTSLRLLSMRMTGAERRQVMGVVIFVVLTVAVFAVLGLAQKLVERL